MDGLTRSELEGLRQAMLLGTARRQLAPPPALASLLAAAPAADPTLPLLGLVGQHRRFERPPSPARLEMPEAATRMHADPRPILPDPMRRLLARIVDWVHKDRATSAVLAAARHIKAAGLRLHPFDFPRLLPLIGGDWDSVGIAERAFLALLEPLAAHQRYRHTEVTVANWTEAASPDRGYFLRRQRAVDPAAARALAEAAFRSQPAAVRVEIVDALDVRIGPGDLPFLEQASSDRAQTVKAAATSLMARIPGTAAHAARLATAAGWFKSDMVVKIIGLAGVTARAPLIFVRPPGTASNALTMPATSPFTGLSLPELASNVSVPVQEVLDALPDDDSLFWSFHRRAVDDRDTATVQMLARWKLIGGGGYPRANDLFRLAVVRVLLSEEAATAVLSSSGWNDAVARLVREGSDDGTLIYTAIMVPARSMPTFLATITSSSGAVQGARAFAELVIMLDDAAPGRRDARA
jgi:hypothetical protein